AFLALFLLSSLVGCDDDPDETDAGTDGGDTDAGTPDAGTPDAGDRGDAGMIECVFNSDCPADQRCECADEMCFCQVGERGTGQNGIDTCTDGNDCGSSVCVEGPASGTEFYC